MIKTYIALVFLAGFGFAANTIMDAANNEFLSAFLALIIATVFMLHGIYCTEQLYTKRRAL